MISIILTTYNRPSQLLATLHSIDNQHVGDSEIVVVDDGNDARTPGICYAFDVRYFRLQRLSSKHYRNQARPLNVGIKAAQGEIVIIQNAECKHVGSNVILDLAGRVTWNSVAFAYVTAMNQDGTRGICYCGPDNPRPYFFCGAIRREWLMKLRGFDEDYQGYGYEDDSMAERLKIIGIQFEFTDISVHHQWHEPAGMIDMSDNAKLFEQKMKMLHTGMIGPVCNLEREWGILT